MPPAHVPRPPRWAVLLRWPMTHCSFSCPARFLASGNLDKQTGKGSTALHYCCLTDNAECLKLLLRGKASIETGEWAPPWLLVQVLGSCHLRRPQSCPPKAGASPACSVRLLWSPSICCIDFPSLAGILEVTRGRAQTLQMSLVPR